MKARKSWQKGWVRKKCARCGHASLRPPGERRCKRPRFGKGSYACWGELQPVVRQRRDPLAVDPPPGAGLGWHLTEDAEAQRMEKFREQARRDLERARRHLGDATSALTAAGRRVREWQTRVARLEKRAVLTDAEIRALREKGRAAAAAKGPKRRAMAVGGL